MDTKRLQGRITKAFLDTADRGFCRILETRGIEPTPEMRAELMLRIIDEAGAEWLRLTKEATDDASAPADEVLV